MEEVQEMEFYSPCIRLLSSSAWSLEHPKVDTRMSRSPPADKRVGEYNFTLTLKMPVKKKKKKKRHLQQ